MEPSKYLGIALHFLAGRDFESDEVTKISAMWERGYGLLVSSAHGYREQRSVYVQPRTALVLTEFEFLHTHKP